MYEVEWLQEALDDLTRVWMQAGSADRVAITTAVSAVDELLTAAPDEQGESREGNERVLFAFPVGFQIKVDSSQRIVWVAHVWYVKRRR